LRPEEYLAPLLGHLEEVGSPAVAIQRLILFALASENLARIEVLRVFLNY
jgi:hypothetical protein